MKRPGSFFLWIALLAAGLLISITIAQVVTQNSLSRLRKGNEQASSTFTMNNRLQEMVNLAFELESKMLTARPAELVSPKRGIKDSLTRLEYNMTVLTKMWSDTVQREALGKIAELVQHLTATSFGLLNAMEKNEVSLQNVITDSLRKNHWGDSIYTAAIAFQKGIERNLNVTTEQNTIAASQLSFLNRLLAGVALLAVLVLATIIIRRQVKQLSLIKDLEEARKTALQSVEAKDQFMANMSHEIRTPLNAIRGFGRILTQTPLNEEQQKYTSIISTASENLLNIVNDILDFSKIEAGNLVMKNKVFKLAEVMNEVELMFTPLAQEKELQLIFSSGPGQPEFIRGDPERLRQILVNLLSNAIKFTNAGTVTISLQYSEGRGNRIKTKFTVADTGVGIPPEKVDIIFERFEQLDHSSTRQQGGTGLGLAITKKLVEAMGGRINLKSEINKGSVFTTELEFEKVNHLTAGQELMTPVHSTDSVSLSHIRILVAEDNMMNQLLVESILEKYDVVADIVENGEEALTAMRSQKYDLVLMDVQMPMIDGITATRLVRKEISSNLPIIAMTAHVLPGEREKCIDAGMNDYLSKPLDEDEVIAMLKRYFSLQKKKKDVENDTVSADWMNMNYLNSICGNDQDRIRLIFKELKKQLPAELAALRKSVESMNLAEIKRVCHHLKSSLLPFSPDSSPVIILNELNNLLHSVLDENTIKEKANQLIKVLVAANAELERILLAQATIN